MNRKRKLHFKAFVALLLTGVLTVNNNLTGPFEIRAARATLDNITAIADDHSAKDAASWNILEIVPEATRDLPAIPEKGIEAVKGANAGSIGYLIGGQEPFTKLTDRNDIRNMIGYLKEKKALDGIAGSILSDGGDYREYLEDMDISSARKIASVVSSDTVSLDGIKMERKENGDFVKTYVSGDKVSANKAKELIENGDQTDFENSSGGDFQPAFKSGSGYFVKFEAIDTKVKKYAYKAVVKHELEVGAGWSDAPGYKAGSYVYSKNDDKYVFEGTLSKDSAGKISVSSGDGVNAANAVNAGNEENTNSGNTENTGNTENNADAEGSGNTNSTENAESQSTYEVDMVSNNAGPALNGEGSSGGDSGTSGESSGSAGEGSGSSGEGGSSAGEGGGSAGEGGGSSGEGGASAGEGGGSAGGDSGSAGEGGGSSGEGSGAAGEGGGSAGEGGGSAGEGGGSSGEGSGSTGESGGSTGEGGGSAGEGSSSSGTGEEPVTDPSQQESDEGAKRGAANSAPAAGAKIYILSFEYTENETADPLYHVVSWNAAAGGDYALDEQVLYPDLTGNGLVKEKNGSGDYIVYCFDPGKGGYMPSAESGAPLIHEKGAGLYWTGGWTNNEWFKKYVFDRDNDEEYRNLKIAVKTVSAAKVTEDDINSADLVYLSAGSGYFLGGNVTAYNKAAGRDLKTEVAKKILEKAADAMESDDARLPILVERGILDTAGDCVIKYLADALCVDDYKAAFEEFDGTKAVGGEKKTGSFVNYRVYMFAGVNAVNTGANGNGSGPDSGRVVNTGFDSSIEGDGFSDVSRFITYVNTSRGNAEKVEVKVSEATSIRHIIGYGERIVKGVYRVLEIEPEDLSGHRSKVDTFLKSNEKEDVKLFYDLSVSVDNKVTYLRYRDHSPSTDAAGYPEYTIFKTRGDIVLTQMSVHEFIGRIEDLNSEYDMIFIGADINGNNCMGLDASGKKVIVNKEADKKKIVSYCTVYNDGMDSNGNAYFNSGLNGKIYRKTGDWAIGNDTRKYKYSPGGYSKAEAGKKELRMDSSDLIKSDIERLEEFVKSELPVVIEDKLLSANKSYPSKYTVEEGSNMFDALKMLTDKKYKGKNVFAVSEVTVGKPDNSVLMERMEVARPFIQLKEVNGQEISESGRVVDAEDLKDGSGKYMLEVKFRIEDDMGDKDTRYGAEFYLDRNADGQFADNENDHENVIFSGKSDDLKKDETYTITRYFNEYQNGTVPWSIVIYQYDDDEDSPKRLRRSNIKGYARIERSERPKVKILQLNTANTGNMATTLDMQKEYINNNTTMGKYLRDERKAMYFDLNILTLGSKEFIDGLDQTIKVNNKDQKRIANLDPDFGDPGDAERIKNKFKAITDAAKNNGVPEAQLYLDFYHEFDLVICGFGDMYWFGNVKGDATHLSRIDSAADALLTYVEEGRSLLLTHDCCIADKERRIPFTDYMFDIVGMNRFGAKGQKRDGTEIDKLRYSKAYPGDKTAYDDEYDDDRTLGGTYMEIMRFQGGNDNQKRGYNRLISWRGLAGQNYETFEVTQVNDGQITSYPYELGSDPLTVQCTHAQDFQLNLNIDWDQDHKRDLVVWYCLGQGTGDTTAEGDRIEPQKYIYSNTKNDVRNNYFIYSKGNVTYTGQGHYGDEAKKMGMDREKVFAECTDKEAQLFINTLVAAYNAQFKKPSLEIHATAAIDSPIKETEILPFDTGVLEELAGSADANTYVNDEAHPDKGWSDEADPDKGPYITMYFLPEELNVNIDSSESEVAFYVEDDKSGAVLSNAGKENKDNGVETVTNDVIDPNTKVVPLNNVTLKRLDGYTEGGTPITTASTVINSLNSQGGGSVFAMEILNGHTMYSATFPLSEIVDKQKYKGELSALAVSNLPKVYVVLHNRTVRLGDKVHNYTSAPLKFARAQLFMLE